MDNIAPEGHPIYDFSNPRRFGPGMWLSFMLMSLEAESQRERDWACKHIRDASSFIKCLACRYHAHEYLQERPPELSAVDNLTLFSWIVTFLNSVNARQGKPLYDAEILRRQFTDDKFMTCNSGCDKDPVAVPLKNVHRTRIRSQQSFVLARHKP